PPDLGIRPAPICDWACVCHDQIWRSREDRKLVQRSWQDSDGNKRQTVEIQVTHVGPDLQFATAEVAKSTAEGFLREERL
ncbi:MAG: hypothetical protein QOK47_367, partial [Actinomycetota bacterium]|nr:hypothetical protein [Actinomycetota bacterium]